MDLEGLGGLAADARGRAVAVYRLVLPVLEARTKQMIGFIFTPLGRWAIIAAILGITWMSVASHYEKRGANKLAAKIERKISENARSADVARKSVSKLPDSLLRDSMTRD